MANYVTATFTEGETKAVATGLWQWDYGQTLRVEGLNLPRTLEVHFHQRTRQWLMYGVTVDGVMTVSIPNEFLQYAQPVVAYIYLHDAETDGETQYEITLPVVAREKPVDYDETDPATTAAYQALVDATTLLRDDIETVQGYANEASDHATAAEGYAINAEDAAAQAAASATAAGAASDTAQAAATAAAQSATQAAGSAQTANASAQNADQSAQDAAQSAQDSAQTVQTVEDAAEQVAADKAAVEAAADTFTETTVPNATAAVQQEGAIQIAAINAAGTTQTGNVNSAGSTQTAAVNAAGATQIQAITAKGEEYIEEIDTLIEEHIDDTLTQTGMAADAKKTGDEIADLKDAYEQIEAEKADTDGTYPDMTVGMAEQLDSDNYTEDSEPYHFRKSGGGSVRVGEREVDEIVGGTVAWNQLANDNYSTGWSAAIVTRSVNDDEVTLTSINDTVTVKGLLRNGDFNGHVIYGAALVKSNGTNGVAIGFRRGGANISAGYSNVGWSTGTSYVMMERLAKPIANDQVGIFLQNDTPNGASGTFKNVMLIDLTAAFGSTIADYIYSLEQSTAGAGVAFVRKYIDVDTYHPYDAGTLKSVEGLVSHDMVWFNQWDEEWENGYINDNGQNSTLNTAMRSKDYIAVVPGSTYYIRCPNTAFIFHYDASKTFIGKDSTHGSGGNLQNETFVIPQSTRYIRFCLYDTPTYNHDICINLSDPAKNGTYEPYEKHSYPLDSDVTLRGVFKLVDGKLVADGDEYASDGTVTRRYGVVDLGTLNYTRITSYDHPIFYATVAEKENTNVHSGICSRFIIMGNAINAANAVNMMTADKTAVLSRNTTNPYIYIRDDSYTDAATFKTAMSGVMLVYELTTPTTETAEPFQNPQWVDGSGTEQYVSTSLVPIGHYTQYPEDLKAKIEGLPWDFASLIAPTEATYKATQNYTSGSLLIVNNILYKTTAAIANGGNITPGTNCTATTLAAVIAAL